jgi:putative acetyltransferase
MESGQHDPVRRGAMITVTSVDPLEKNVRVLVAKLDAYQSSLYPPESNHLDSAKLLQQDHVRMFAAKDGEAIVGCGAVKILDGYAELKRMYVISSHRSRGIAALLLDRLEKESLACGLTTVRLETGVLQQAALNFYRSNGYVDRGPYGAYKTDPLSVYMEKLLTPASNTN